VEGVTAHSETLGGLGSDACRTSCAIAGELRIVRHRSISTGSSCRFKDLRNLFAFFGATLGGWLGWWLGEYVGFMTAFIVSVFGSAIGVYVGRRVVDNLLA